MRIIKFQNIFEFKIFLKYGKSYVSIKIDNSLTFEDAFKMDISIKII